MEKPRQRTPIVKLGNLRQSIIGVKRSVLNNIVSSYLDTGAGILANDLYREFKKHRVIESLRALGGSLVNEVEDYEAASNRFEPTFLGVLTSSQGSTYERFLVRFLGFAEELFLSKKEGEEIANAQIERLLSLNRDDAFKLFRVVRKGYLCGNCGYSEAEKTWRMRLFREVHDLPSWSSKRAFLHSRATRFYDPNAPVFIAERYTSSTGSAPFKGVPDTSQTEANDCDLVFISYSHKDKKFLSDLLTHLRPIIRGNLIAAWSDKQIAPGDKWYSQIKAAIARTKVAVLMVSSDFLASDFIHAEELGPLLQDAEKGGVRIMWVPVRACSYKDSPLVKYQAATDPEKPLARQQKAERDASWVAICEAIKSAAIPKNY